MAWVLGGRDTSTFQRLYDKVKHLTDCTFYTDDWEAFAKVLPSTRHIIGKAHTIAIERDNSNRRRPWAGHQELSLCLGCNHHRSVPADLARRYDYL